MAYYDCECDSFEMTEGLDSFEMNEGIPGPGVPAGGTTGQVLRKASATNYDTEWDTLDASDIQYSSHTVDDEITDLWFSFDNLGSQMLDKADKYSIADSDFSPTLYAHASGTYFFINNTLYKALVDISVGDTITTTGTNPNAIQAILGDDVSDLKNTLNQRSEIYINIVDESNFLKASGWAYAEPEYNGSNIQLVLTFGTDNPFPIGEAFKSNTQYAFSIDAYNESDSTTGNGLVFKIVYTDNTESNGLFLSNSTKSYAHFTGVSTAGKTIQKIYITYGSGSGTWHLKNFQIEEGTLATNYVPYKPFVDFYARDMLGKAFYSPSTLNAINDCNDAKLDNSVFFVNVGAGSLDHSPFTDWADGTLWSIQNYGISSLLMLQIFENLENPNAHKRAYRYYNKSTGTFGSWTVTSFAFNLNEVNNCNSMTDDNMIYLVNTSAGSLSNAPFTDWSDGTLWLVKNYKLTDAFRTQIFENVEKPNESKRAFRTFNKSNNTFYGWTITEPTGAIFEIGTGKPYTTLRAGIAAAIQKKNSKVIVYPGVYDIATEFATEIANESGTGIELANGVDITFMAGAYVTCLLDGSSEWCYRNFEPFHTTSNSSWTLNGLHIKCSNTRYCVHDEHGSSGTYVHKYINCHMEQEDNMELAFFHQCIGGGMGEHGYIYIDGGYYKSHSDYALPGYTVDEMQQPITYHNGDSNTCDGKIFIRNVYLADKGYFRFGNHGVSTIKTPVEISGCSMYRDVYEMFEQPSDSTVNFEVIKFNNEIRGN